MLNKYLVEEQIYMVDGQGEKQNIHENNCGKVVTESFANGFYFYLCIMEKLLNIFKSRKNGRINPILPISQP